MIIDQELKTIIGIESKATLSFRTGKDAAAQTQRLKEVLEQYFEPELAGSDWYFVAMVHFNKLDLRQPICTSCSPFTIHEAKTLATKLADVETHLKAVRPMWSSSHQEYVALAEGLSFVFSSAPISTRCTITSDVYAKVVGKPETSSSKAKVGQGDYKSIIFWTNEQLKVMIWNQQFVVFISPWSTGKTICMRERARMWATENPSEKLYFCVVRNIITTNTSMQEFELKLYFREHNADNVTVLGFNSSPEEALSELYKMISSKPAGSWMVDELEVPRSPDHTKWAEELQKMRRRVARQAGSHVLWVSIAGITSADPRHFKHDYLALLMTGF